MKLSRVTEVLQKIVGAFALAVCATSSHAADYPSRPITMIVPQAAGGSNDIVGRVAGQKLAEVLGGTVVVENKPGAGGNIGTQAAAKASKDGHTLLMTISSAQAINPSLYKNPGFDPIKDFTPIAYIGAVPNVLVVNPKFPAKTLDEFIQLAKAKPGFYQYASAGNGTLNHLLGEMLNNLGGVSLQHIPYKGVQPALNDVLAGQVQIAFASLPSVLQYIKSGELIALGVSAAKRSPVLPEVPAIGEKIPGYEGVLWVGLFSPQGVSPPIVTQLEAAMQKVVANTEMRSKLAALGMEFANVNASEFATLMRDDIARWNKIVKSSGASLD